MTEDWKKRLPTESKADWVKRRKAMWANNNSEKIRAASAKWRAGNPEKVKEIARKYRESGKATENNRLYRRRRAAGRMEAIAMLQIRQLGQAFANGTYDHSFSEEERKQMVGKLNG
ncbi:hypothetical protein A6U88_02425 [Agrobacterium sp. B131/95]|nr:hypothetical protein A6U88_02425 [Agrobacterium sp. B131/95]